MENFPTVDKGKAFKELDEKGFDAEEVSTAAPASRNAESRAADARAVLRTLTRTLRAADCVLNLGCVSLRGASGLQRRVDSFLQREVRARKLEVVHGWLAAGTLDVSDSSRLFSVSRGNQEQQRQGDSRRRR